MRRLAPSGTPSFSQFSVVDFLASTDWFHRLPPDRQRWIRSRITTRSVGASQYLARTGEVATHGYTVLEGLLVWSVSNEDGADVTVAAMLQGAWFGHGTLLGKYARKGSVVALRDSRVACMPEDVFQWLLSESLSFNEFLVRHAFARIHWLMGVIAARVTLSVDQQVARAIVGLTDKSLNPGTSLDLELSQEELARMVGYTRQRCSGAIQRMKADGILQTRYGRISVSDEARLGRFAEGTDGAALTKPKAR